MGIVPQRLCEEPATVCDLLQDITCKSWLFALHLLQLMPYLVTAAHFMENLHKQSANYIPVLERMLRVFPRALASETRLVFCLQLLAWQRLAQAGLLPPHLLPAAWQHRPDVDAVAQTFAELGAHRELRDARAAFTTWQHPQHYITPGQLDDLLGVLGSVDLHAPADAISLTDFVGSRCGLQGGLPPGLPAEVADLMAALSQLIPEGQAAYVPFETTTQLARRLWSGGVPPIVSTPFHSPVPALLNLLTDAYLTVRVGDELATPLAWQAGQPQRFAVGCCFPPLDGRAREEAMPRPHYERLVPAPTSLAALVIHHLLALVTERIVVGLPNGLLYTPGTERNLREQLLLQQQVEAVIALPPALLPGTALQASLLVLSPGKRQEQVLFVDGTQAAFYTKVGRNRRQLTGWRQLAALVQARQTGGASCLVPVETLLNNDCNLQVSRYCVAAPTVVAEAATTVVPLQALVDFVRPLPVPVAEPTMPVAEITPGDFPTAGYLTAVSRTAQVAKQQWARWPERQVRALDVLITMKGATGRVALLAPGFETPAVVGQACLALRVRDAKQLDARVLFSFLRSAAGQAQLQRIVSTGSTAPVLQLRELKQVSIPLPSPAQQQVIMATIAQAVVLEEEIQTLLRTQAQLLEAPWEYLTLPAADTSATTSALHEDEQNQLSIPFRVY
jgi:type I restriction enzyme M protein